MKRAVSLILCIVLVASLAVPASASLQYTYIDTVAVTMDINEFWGIASCHGAVDSIDPNMLEVDVYLRIYRNDQWETLKHWSGTGQYVASASGEYAIARGYRYQTYVVGYVYDDNGNIIESGSVSDEMYY